MKQFFRTPVGKTLVFLLCIAAVITSALSICGVVYALQEAETVYGSSSKEEFMSDLFLRQLRYEGYGPVSIAADYQKYGEGTGIRIGDRGNVNIKVEDEEGNLIASTDGAESVRDWKYSLRYQYVSWNDENGDNEYDIICLDNNGGFDPRNENTSITEIKTYTVYYSLKDGFPEFDEYHLINRFGPAAFSLRYSIYVIAVLSVLTVILSYVALMFLSGKKPGTEEICPGPFNKVPFDVMAAAAVLICTGGAFLANDAGEYTEIILGIATAILILCCFIGLSMSAATRIKQGTLLRNTLTAKAVMFAAGVLGAVWGLTKKVFAYFLNALKNIPVTWKTALCFVGLTLFEIIMIISLRWEEEQAIFIFVERLILFPAVIMLAMNLRKLRDSGRALASGDLSHHTNTNGMFWDFKRHAEDLNNIAVGMSIAVEDRLKSERMKTELITNVSHDIKTPLTSIINYATLIGEEKSGNEKIDEYSEVLVRQSERLKRLIEDLVEASKASTGNLDVEPVPCDASVFLDQITGEYQEKLQAADLTLVTKAPDKEIRIMADGRRMWRIFDNLMNNICKYALAGTRVYLSLEEMGDDAVFTFKNTSREELNISEEELMERFTRGDSSRNTEGNGLGLSIARSMAELQGGTLDLAIDGDLFKAILRFPRI